MGSGENGELTFLDVLSIISFCVGLQNLDLNITANDIDNQTQELDKRLHNVVNDIQAHLEIQDRKLDYISKRLEDLNYDNGRDV